MQPFDLVAYPLELISQFRIVGRTYLRHWFGTLGYGDMHAFCISRPFAMFQAFAGMFMMALFAIVFGRKVMRG